MRRGERLGGVGWEGEGLRAVGWKGEEGQELLKEKKD